MNTIDVIILAAVAVLLLLALRSTLRHYSGKGGGCCGCSGCSGGSSSCTSGVKAVGNAQELIEEDTFSKTLQVEGMHCGTCKQSVESALAGVSGVIIAEVNLEAGTAKVFLKKEVPDSFLREAIEDKGFQVKEILKAGA